MAAGAGVRPGCVVEDLRVAAFRIPTDQPESDGTLRWSATTLVVVELTGGGRRGLGYTYAAAAAARLIQDELREVVIGADALQVTGLNDVMTGHLRNQGTEGLTACAVSAIDTALWDLKARFVELPLIDLLGAVRASVPVYGSGGFTSDDDATLAAQFEHWADQGIRNFKLKVGREPARDPHRVRQARTVIGPAAGLFVDGNGAYTPRTALAAAARFAAEADIGWFEQPLPPDDADGLAFVRARLPDRVELATGEYGYSMAHYRRLLSAGAVDVLMADLTRCGGVTGWLQVAALAAAWHVPLSTHCAPALHLHPAGATGSLRHAEYFHDHARIEARLFDGAATPANGVLTPDRTRPGHGLAFKWTDAAAFAV